MTWQPMAPNLAGLHLIDVRKAQQHPPIPVVLQRDQLHAAGQAVGICQEAARARRSRRRRHLPSGCTQLPGSCRLHQRRRPGAAAGRRGGAVGRPAECEDERVVDPLRQHAPVGRRCRRVLQHRSHDAWGCGHCHTLRTPASHAISQTMRFTSPTRWMSTQKLRRRPLKGLDSTAGQHKPQTCKGRRALDDAGVHRAGGERGLVCAEEQLFKHT